VLTMSNHMRPESLESRIFEISSKLRSKWSGTLPSTSHKPWVSMSIVRIAMWFRDAPNDNAFRRHGPR
jgi:hypothetical protein